MTRVKWATPTKVCADCGVTYPRWGPGSGKIRADGARYGLAYYRPCAYARIVRNSQRRDVPAVCAGCGASFLASRGAKYRHLCRATTGRFYCSTRCLGLAQSTYPPNPNGDHLCRAPVPGGCGIERQVSGGKTFAFCGAHKQRHQRGMPMDVVIVRRPRRAP